MIINITSSPYHCPHVSSLLSSKDSLVPSVFKYHQVCQNNTQHLCFYDEIYFCICRINNKGVECFLHDTQLDQCDRCLSGGQCIQRNLNKPNDFLCLSPSCYHGNLCEFNMNPFGFTLDSLLVGHSK
ncbi:unnamed protein product [Adineta steineri]|uniref:EGF-like domain-containing protein n=1 Tax=Adineta steineri TaxID=433720 RepID=A0A813ZG57_9BILA|nr:unnamed protein product [Adineta steineri]CAF1428779.1 unnamed protein product [Adineta steineri]